MNDHDSGRMAALLRSQGFTSTEDPEQADVIIVNTCEVRDKAEQKMLSAVGRYRATKENHPNQVVVVAGCGAQLRGQDLLQRNDHVDIVLGPDQIARLPELLRDLKKAQPVVATDWWQGSGDDPSARIKGEFTPGPVTAFVTAMTGCENHCTYCIVPSTRGAERSRKQSDIVEEVTWLAEAGVREVTLLGQSVNAYGRQKNAPASFADLLNAVAAIDGLRRIRFMTSHPRFIDEPLVNAFANQPKIASHLHLPIQSGSDRVLAKMRRGYNREQLTKRIGLLRQARPDLSITTDFIVGFPGESEEDFAQTLSLVQEIGFDNIFSFAYSERPGTVALGFEDSVEPAERSRRLARLAEVQAPFTRGFLDRHRGQVVEVLVEGVSARDSQIKSGRTSQNLVVNFSGLAVAGDCVAVLIQEAKANTLFGVEK